MTSFVQECNCASQSINQVDWTNSCSLDTLKALLHHPTYIIVSLLNISVPLFVHIYILCERFKGLVLIQYHLDMHTTIKLHRE